MKRSFRAWPLGLVTLLLLVLLPLAGCDSDDPEGVSADVTVMSYNLYLGAEIFELVGIPAEQVPIVAAQLFADVQASNFPARAEAIAAIIEAENPDLIGLQEVTWYRTDPSDNSESPNASTTAFDFLALLQDALDARGLDYRVAATTTNADVEVPSTTDGVTFTDIRLTDRDVILARADVQTTGAVERNFSSEVTAPVPIGGMAVPFARGYNSVRATVDGVTFTFANAHLEVDDGNPQGAALAQFGQANELRNELASAPQPVVLVGDFNSRADGSGTQISAPGFTGTTYGLLRNFYVDSFTASGTTGNTCCQAPDLRNPSSELDQRIDLILYRGAVQTVSAEVVGDEPEDRAEVDGDLLWPSDHAGVVATLRITN